MRLARKLALLAAMALTAMALTASSANAAAGVEVINEDTEAHCDFVAQNCHVHAIGSAQLIAHTIFGEIPVSNCQDEFFAHLDENGTGHIYEYENNHITSPSQCTRINCDPPMDEWDIHTAEEDAQNEGEIRVNFCLEAEGGAENECEIDVHVEEDPLEPHHYIFTADDECDVGGTHVEVIGQWETEETPDVDEDNIEIVHQ